MIVVDVDQLTPVAELGVGGFRTASRVACTDPRLPAQMVFKTPRPHLDPGTGQHLVDRMYKVVGLRDSMSSSDLAELDSLTTWPVAMVARDGRCVGCLTRIIDRDYFVEAAPDGTRTPRLFELGLLCASAERLRALGIARSPADDALVLLALLARLAYAIEVIHRPRGGQRLVYGDLSLRGAAAAVGPPRILLLGCDDVADVEDTSRLQPNTPFYVPPELVTKKQELQDQNTDVYKLGLCVIRGLSVGRGATQLADAASPLVRTGLLDRAGVDLLNDAVGADRARRPTAEEIKDYLVGRVLHLADGRR